MRRDWPSYGDYGSLRWRQVRPPVVVAYSAPLRWVVLSQPRLPSAALISEPMTGAVATCHEVPALVVTATVAGFRPSAIHHVDGAATLVGTYRTKPPSGDTGRARIEKSTCRTALRFHVRPPFTVV